MTGRLVQNSGVQNQNPLFIYPQFPFAVMASFFSDDSGASDAAAWFLVCSSKSKQTGGVGKAQGKGLVGGSSLLLDSSFDPFVILRYLETFVSEFNSSIASQFHH